jgi:hypothetical protein
VWGLPSQTWKFTGTFSITFLTKNAQFVLGIHYFTKINDALESWQLCTTTMMPGRLLWKTIQNRNSKRSGTSSRYAPVYKDYDLKVLSNQITEIRSAKEWYH